MSNPTYTIKPALRCLCRSRNTIHRFRSIATTASHYQEAALQSFSDPPVLDPNLVSTRKEEQQLLSTGVSPIGSRRRRAALQSTSNIPFEQLPYQCFQEARKILQTDREEKLQQIEEERRRIAKAEALDPARCGGDAGKKGKLVAMHKYLEQLKVLADVNDPLIKKRFEDGLGRSPVGNKTTWTFWLIIGAGDMNRPIYRYLADRKWREYKRRVMMQRISQMHVVPDVLPHLDPVAEVSLAFGRRNVQPGEFVDSRVSETLPRLNVQLFEKGEKLVTLVVLDSDVPNVEKDAFDYRCHFLATNISLSPTTTSLPFSALSKESQVVLPWLPPHAQKGSPYHRLSIFVLQQPEGKALDVEAMRKREEREGFNLRSFNDRHLVKPIGVHLFRTVWDEGTEGVMRRAGLEGANVELRRKKPEALPYKKKDGERYR
ncbi:hypothetical protein MMC17_003095 [Xylographa soralifera]|nr:hypothetical protein [Xylographa soralifera]